MLLRYLIPFIYSYFLCTSFCLKAQEVGHLRLFIYPPPETIIVNDSVLKMGNKIELAVGDNRLRFWTPSYKLVDTLINVKGEGFTDFFYEQKHSAAYYKFESEVKSYRNERRLNLDLPLITTVILTGTSIATYINARHAYDETALALEKYKFETLDPDGAYRSYEKKSNEYRDKRLLFYTSTGITLVSGYFLYRGLQWVKKNPALEFQDEKNPLALNYIYILPPTPNANAYQMGLSFNFKRR